MNTANIIKNEDSQEDSDIDSKSVSRRAGTPAFTQVDIDAADIDSSEKSLSSSSDHEDQRIHNDD